MELLIVVVGLVVGLGVGVLVGRRRREPADLAAVRADLGQLRESMARSHGELRQHLASATEQTASLTSTAAALREVLASPKARGQWGERMCDDILRLAGLVEGVSYVKQRATAQGTIPDVTFLLPHGQLLHMDVKFPIDNYVRHVETGDDAARVAFLKDVRARVKELTGRGYVDPAGGTLDYVLLFLPNESIYGFVHDHDPGLIDEALRRKVVLCSPLTLYAVLAVVRHAADAAALEATSGEVLSVLGVFTQEWDRFCESLEKVGRAVDAMERAYGELAGTRRRALERPIARVEELRRTGVPQQPLRAVR